MGDGDIDLKEYFATYAKLCPKCPVHIETISGFNREIPYKKEDFWKTWPNGKPKGFDKFVALAKKGKARESWKARGCRQQDGAEGVPKRRDREEIRYCKTLGLGKA